MSLVFTPCQRSLTQCIFRGNNIPYKLDQDSTQSFSHSFPACPNIVYINTSVSFNLTSNMLTLPRFTVALALASSIFGVTISAVPSRRSGELWEGLEHEEVDLRGLAPSRRSGELWLGAEHEEVDVSSTLALI